MRTMHFFIILAGMVIIGKLMISQGKPAPGPVSFLY